MNEQPIPPHQHFAYGRYFDLEHFVLLVKRCRICDEYMGVETMVKKAEQPKEQINENANNNNTDIPK